MKNMLVMAFVIMAGCVHARDPQLAAMKQSGDSALSCEQIAMEYKTNTEVAGSKIVKNRSNDKKELALAILVWPGLMDMKNADGNEGNALIDRNLYLLELAKTKSCTGVQSWPEQPPRYTMNGYWLA
jgi:hypothetical protein